MRAAIVVGVIFVASAARADEADRLLGMALAEAQLGHCNEALAHLDQYLAATANPSSDAFEVLRRCPRSQTPPPTPTPTPPTPTPTTPTPTPTTPPTPTPTTPPPPTPTPPPRPPAPPSAPPAVETQVAPAPTPAHKPRQRLFLIDVELGVNVPLTSGSPEAAFLGVVELGVALSNRIGLDLVLLAESLVSRAAVGPGGTLATVFSANLLLGLEERRVVWRRLSLFGTVAAGILVDSYKGFRNAVALHVDVGAGWQLGPGELRLRPLDFGILVETDGTVGASWRSTAGYALRF